ncbi:MAG: DNA cytosine methyltransferase, partial [Promethearchaeota archaeon]
CGGFSKGLLDAGWRHVAANEIWDPASDTYEKNISKNIIRGDIRDEEVFKKLVQSVGNKEPLVVVGGPPCQSYSAAGNRNPVDPRGHLWKKYVEFINRVTPVAFVMENVKGLISMQHIDENLDKKTLDGINKAAKNIQRYKDLKRFKRQRALTKEEQGEFEKLERLQKSLKAKVKENLSPLLPRIITTMKNAGPRYEVQYKVLNAAHYGVPQIRKRIIIIGFRNDIYQNMVDNGEEDIIFHPIPTYAEFKDGKPTIPKEFNNHVKKEDLEPFNVVQDTIGDLTHLPENSLPNHVFMKSKPAFIKKIATTKPGKTVYPNYSDAWYRLFPDQPARTVKENHGGVHCHPELPRTLSPRELARIQSFGDDFIFFGKKSNILVQIGNSVPPALGKAIGIRINNLLKDKIDV